MRLLLCAVALVPWCLFATATGECVPRDYGRGSVVCVCSSQKCDPIGQIQKPASNNAIIYESSKAGSRFQSKQVAFTNASLTDDVLELKWTEPNADQQTIIGFGGAFTDAFGINMATLSSDLQTALIKACYGEEGLNYNMGRVPMASCDFSPRIYTYDDTPNDFDLTNFQLAPEDLQYKIPYIQLAKQQMSVPLNLFSSPWSAPAWMKTNNNTIHGGSLIGQPGGQYYKTWAQYFVKFFDAYKQNGVTFWGLTVENEPTQAYNPEYKFQSMAFTGETERDFVKMDLGPALESAGYGDLNLMIYDDNRNMIQNFTDIIYADPDASKYVAGAGVHWYGDGNTSPDVFDQIKTKFPEKYILATEACAGWRSDDTPHASLGDWGRGEQYANSIMGDLQHNVAGWIDWNMALDLDGGPNWVDNYADAPIIINATANEFYLQPTYFSMAHFSKFIPSNSQRTSWTNQNGLMTAAFERPDRGSVFVIFNTGDSEESYKISDDRIGSFSNTIGPRAIQSILYYA